MRARGLLVGLIVIGLLAGAAPLAAQAAIGKPTIGAITGTSSSLTVPWTPPTDNGGSAITAYDLRFVRTDADESEDSNWTVLLDVWVTGGGALSFQLMDLPDGVGFDVQIRAENANGDIGDWSDTASATTTDHGNDRASATALSLGGSVVGRIDPGDDLDVFSIVLTSATDLWIYADGELDSVGRLLNSSGGGLAFNDQGNLPDAPDGFSIRRRVAAGTYYIEVASYRQYGAGSYTVYAQSATDPGSTAATALTITSDSKTPGRISQGTSFSDFDEDFFRLDLSETTDVWVMGIGNLDTVGELLDADQNRLEIEDDSGYLDSETSFMLRRELDVGTYYIRVTGFYYLEEGPYTLIVRTADDPGDSTAGALPIRLGQAVTGKIASHSDSDYFSLTLAEDTYVFIYALGVNEILPLSATVLDDNGQTVNMDQVITYPSWASHGRFRVSFSIWGQLEAGSYHIRVQRTGSETGFYLLHPLISSYQQSLDRCTAISTSQSDPWYGCQWHLNNSGQFPGGAGEDINVESVWSGGNEGAGVNVAIVDDGLQANHPDLSPNVVNSRNHSYFGNLFHPLETHGTAVAGLVAAAANSIGVRGVAPQANIYTYNLIARNSRLTDNEADAMTRNLSVTAVSNNSWGTPPNGMPRNSGVLWRRAVERGVNEGFGGKGIVYVWSGGNGHQDSAHANLDGRANFYAVTAVCAVGYDDKRSVFSETGANLWVCAPSNGTYPLPGIATTHQLSRYRDAFGGTSASTPIVSGVVALVRAENPELSWRDVKLILAASARQNDAADSGWQTGSLEYGSTSERYRFNLQYGFGMVDAAAAVDLADGWTNVPAMREIEAEDLNRDLAIVDSDHGVTTLVETELTFDPFVEFVEFIQVEVDLDHDRFRDLHIELESPSGAVSELSAAADDLPLVSDALQGWDGGTRFGSARHLEIANHRFLRRQRWDAAVVED